MALALLAAVADVLTPLYAGKLIDAVASGAAGDAQVWHAAMTAFWLLVALGLGAMLLRQAVLQHHRLHAAHDERHDVQRLPPRAAPVHRLARQQLRRFDRAQDHARHVGGRPAQRHAADRPAAPGGDAGGRHRAAGLALAADGAGGGPGLGDVYRVHRAAVAALRGAGRAPGQRLGHAHGRRAGRRRDLQRRGQAFGAERREKRGWRAWSTSGAAAPAAPGCAAR